MHASAAASSPARSSAARHAKAHAQREMPSGSRTSRGIMVSAFEGENAILAGDAAKGRGHLSQAIILPRMRILLSNDDGYFAPGLAALAEGLAPLGEITVVAPERDRSGASNSLTLDRPLMVRRAANGFSYVNGTPTDCVHLAVTGFLEHQPDVVVSGINYGANM